MSMDSEIVACVTKSRDVELQWRKVEQDKVSTNQNYVNPFTLLFVIAMLCYSTIMSSRSIPRKRSQAKDQSLKVDSLSPEVIPLICQVDYIFACVSVLSKGLPPSALTWVRNLFADESSPDTAAYIAPLLVRSSTWSFDWIGTQRENDLVAQINAVRRGIIQDESAGPSTTWDAMKRLQYLALTLCQHV